MKRKPLLTLIHLLPECQMLHVKFNPEDGKDNYFSHMEMRTTEAGPKLNLKSEIRSKNHFSMVNSTNQLIRPLRAVEALLNEATPMWKLLLLKLNNGSVSKNVGAGELKREIREGDLVPGENKLVTQNMGKSIGHLLR